MASSTMPKSLLMVGPRGGGKTSAARIVAKLVNCEKNPSTSSGQVLTEPCLKCESCLSIEKGSNIDVIEMDAASNRGIDAIRDIRDRVTLAPVNGRFKVYIIDEVHMLTTEAFNALLKTLEEPPAHVMFILCTTEEQKVPETIKSRCTRVQFYKAGAEEVKRSLQKAIDGEKLKIDAKALELLAKSVDGSFREGHKLLEVLSTSGKEIGLSDAEGVLGQSSGAKARTLAEFLVEGDVQQALTEIDEAHNLGVDTEGYTRAVLEQVRAWLKQKYGIGSDQNAASANRLLKVLQVVSRAAVEIKTAAMEQLPLEMAAVELGLEESTESKPIMKKEANIETAPQREIVTETITKVILPEVAVLPPKEEKEDTLHESALTSDVSIGEVISKWSEVVRSIAPINSSLAGLLRSTKPKSVENHALVIEVFYKFHKEQLEQDTKRRLIEDALRQLTGLNQVRLVLGEKATSAMHSMPEVDNIELVPEDGELAQAVQDIFGN